jgi:hypothetical protein
MPLEGIMKHRKRKHERLINELVTAFGHTDRAKRRARLSRELRTAQRLRNINPI